MKTIKEPRNKGSYVAKLPNGKKLRFKHKEDFSEFHAFYSSLRCDSISDFYKRIDKYMKTGKTV